MKVQIETNVFRDVVLRASKIINKNTTIEIIKGILLTATKEGLVVTATNSDMTIQETIIKGVKIESEGAVVVPAKELVQLVKVYKRKEMNVQANENNHITIENGKTQIQIPGLNAEEFPNVPEINADRIKLNGDTLKNMIESTIFACATSEARPNLTGIKMELDKKQLVLEATDSHRLARKSFVLDDVSEEAAFLVVVPGGCMSYLASILKPEEIQLGFTVSQLVVEMGDLLFISRLLDVKYPDTKRIIPQSFSTKIDLKREEVIEAINLVTVVNDWDIIRLTITENDELKIEAKNVGQAYEYVPIQNLEGENISLPLNPKYLYDALRASQGESIRIGFTGKPTTSVLPSLDAPHELHLLLPVRDK